MMNKLKAKLKKQGGFTLVEMLIVVAIIAILVAVSIPLIGTSLDKAKEATDSANLRAAKAEAVIMYYNHQIDSTLDAPAVGMIYDNVKGAFVPAGSSVTDYGQQTGHTKITITAVNDGAAANADDDIVTVEWS